VDALTCCYCQASGHEFKYFTQRFNGLAGLVDALPAGGSGVWRAVFFRERKQRLLLLSKLDVASKRLAANLIFDDLTGLLSRGGFNAELDKAIAQADASGSKSR